MISKDLNNINKELVSMETNISSFYQEKCMSSYSLELQIYTSIDH